MTPPLPTLILAKADSKSKMDEPKLNRDFLVGTSVGLAVPWLLSLYPNPANKKQSTIQDGTLGFARRF